MKFFVCYKSSYERFFNEKIKDFNIMFLNIIWFKKPNINTSFKYLYLIL